MSPPILWGLHVSPWTEKARWALDHHGIAYRYREHTPMLGEPTLRLRSRGRPPGARATVPLLIDGRERITDSGAIARHADRRGQGEPLIPAEHREAIESWEREVEATMHAGRVLIAQALLDSPAAQIEMLPPPIPAPLRRLLLPLARAGAGFFVNKYDAGPERVAASMATLTGFAERLRERLDGGLYLVGDRFSLADVCASMVVNGFSGGVPGRLAKLPASAQTWTRPELVERFADLIAWRDRLYAEHRPSSARVR
jgi:glutathione S-transferase